MRFITIHELPLPMKITLLFHYLIATRLILPLKWAMPTAAAAAMAAPQMVRFGEHPAAIFEVIINALAEWGRGRSRVLVHDWV